MSAIAWYQGRKSWKCVVTDGLKVNCNAEIICYEVISSLLLIFFFILFTENEPGRVMKLLLQEAPNLLKALSKPNPFSSCSENTTCF